jgi:ubiquinone/menaquinone biosynthesis C-methylase UbiE/O-antigen/teichoic acid export membrane protein
VRALRDLFPARAVVGRIDPMVLKMISNAASIVGTVAITSIVGFAYWLVAARLFSAPSVGLASALISAMILLGTVSVFGFGTLLVGELSRKQGEEGSLIATGSLAAGCIGMLLGVGFGLIAPHLSGSFRPLDRNYPVVFLFAVGVALTGVSLVFDTAVIGLFLGRLQLLRNGLFAAIKLAALLIAVALLPNRNWETIYGTWVLGNLLSFAAPLAMLLRSVRGRPDSVRPQMGLLIGNVRAALGHHGLNLALQAPPLLLPLVVTITLSTTKNAAFYIAWNVAWFAVVGPNALTMVLFAVGVSSPGTLPRDTRISLRLGLLGGAIGTVLLVVFANPILSAFGSVYTSQAVVPLKILSLAVLPLTIKSHYVALSRIRGRQATAARLMTAGLLLELALAVVGTQLGGLAGLSAGWVLALCIEAVLALPAVLRQLRAEPYALNPLDSLVTDNQGQAAHPDGEKPGLDEPFGFQERVDAHFESEAPFWKEVYQRSDLRSLKYVDRRSLALAWIDRLGIPPGARVLEVGCGAGVTAVALAERSLHVEASDTVPAMVALTLRNALEAGVKDRVEARIADAHSLPYEDQAFKLVLALGLVPWLHSPAQGVREMARVLSDDGFLVASFDTRISLRNVMDPLYNPWLAGARRLTRRILEESGVRIGTGQPRATLHDRVGFRRMLEAAGLESVEIYGFGYGPFTVFGRHLLGEASAKRLDRILQRLADTWLPAVQNLSVQSLVVASRRETGQIRHEPTA